MCVSVCVCVCVAAVVAPVAAKRALKAALGVAVGDDVTWSGTDWFHTAHVVSTSLPSFGKTVQLAATTQLSRAHIPTPPFFSFSIKK